MKKNTTILLLFSLTIGWLNALSQSHNFSDWNVPPPIPPGTIPKSGGSYTSKTITIPNQADVNAPFLRELRSIVLDKLSPVLMGGLYVSAPNQPVFPNTPYQDVFIPTPQVPDIFISTLRVPQDQNGNISLNIPSPQVPELPDMPKKPDTTGSGGGGGTSGNITIPIIPSLLKEPGAELSSIKQSSFMEWPVPPIPLNVNNTITIMGNPDEKKPRKRN